MGSKALSATTAASAGAWFQDRFRRLRAAAAAVTKGNSGRSFTAPGEI